MRLPAIVVLAALSGACASTGSVPKPFPMPGPISTGIPAPPAEPSFNPTEEVIASALALLGVPYRNGGSDPSGFDCSGLTQYVFAQQGVFLPREVREQIKAGRAVGAQEVGRGDLVFFRTTGRGASHVGIVVNDDQFIHAPSSKGVVRVERLSADYWAHRFVGARRIASD